MASKEENYSNTKNQNSRSYSEEESTIPNLQSPTSEQSEPPHKKPKKMSDQQEVSMSPNSRESSSEPFQPSLLDEDLPSDPDDFEANISEISGEILSDRSDDDERPTEVREPLKLTVNQEQDAVKWYQEHPMFWDKSDPLFKNKKVKDKKMREQATSLGITLMELEGWFRSQRTYYTRNKSKIRSGKFRKSLTRPPTSRQAWNLKSFAFLDEHIKVKSESCQLSQGLCTQYSETHVTESPDLDDLPGGDAQSQNSYLLQDESQNEQPPEREHMAQNQVNLDNVVFKFGEEPFQPSLLDAELPRGIGQIEANNGEFSGGIQSDGSDDDGRPIEVRQPMKLTVRQEQAAVKWYQAHPMFWDKADPFYKDKKVKDMKMREQATSLGITFMELEGWFRSQRTTYSRNKMKIRSGKFGKSRALTSRQKWNLKSFEFLDEHIQVRSEISQLGQGLYTQHPDTYVTESLDPDGLPGDDGQSQDSYPFQDESQDKQPLERQHMARKQVNLDNVLFKVDEEPFQPSVLDSELSSDLRHMKSNNGDIFVGAQSEGSGDDERPTEVRQPLKLTVNQEQSAVKWYKAHPMFWDKADPFYKHKNVKEMKMRKQATRLGITFMELEGWFRSQRTTYIRNKSKIRSTKFGKSRARPLTSRQAWNLKSFAFLEEHIQGRSESFQLGQGLSTHYPGTHVAKSPDPDGPLRGDDQSHEDYLEQFQPSFSDADLPSNLGHSEAYSGEFSGVAQSDESDGDERSTEAREPLKLTVLQEQAAVKWYQENPMFWDKADPFYKDKKMKDTQLREQATRLGITLMELDGWFKGQRTTYTRNKWKIKSGNIVKSRKRPLTRRQTWNLKNFAFLDEHIQVRSESCQLGQGLGSQYPKTHVSGSPNPNGHPGGDDQSQDDSLSQDESQDEHPPECRHMMGNKGNIDKVLVKLGKELSATLRMQRLNISKLQNDSKAIHHNWMAEMSQEFPSDIWAEYVQQSSQLLLYYRHLTQERLQRSMPPPKPSQASTSGWRPQPPPQQHPQYKPYYQPQGRRTSPRTAPTTVSNAHSVSNPAPSLSEPEVEVKEEQVISERSDTDKLSKPKVKVKKESMDISIHTGIVTEEDNVFLIPEDE